MALAFGIPGALISVAGSGGGGSLTDGNKGDVTVSGSGTVWTINGGAVTYSKIQNVSATDKVLGRATAGAGIVEEIACTAAGRALIAGADAAAQRTTLGLGTAATAAASSFEVPLTFSSPLVRTVNTISVNTFGAAQAGVVPSSGGGTTNYLRADGTWAAPPGGGGVTDGDKGDITVSGSGTVWTVDNAAITYAKIQNISATDRILGRQTASAGPAEEITCTAYARSILDDPDATTARGTLGLGTAATQNSTAFEAPLTFNAPLSRSTNTISASTFTSGASGVVPASGGGTTNYLRADGSWAAPAGGGGGGLGFETFRAETLDPADSTWTNTTTADLVSSVSTASVQVVSYSGSTLQARGEVVMPPASASTVTIDIVFQAASAPGVTNNKVQWRIASRSLDAGTNTNYDPSVVTNANNTSFATFTLGSAVSLATLGWTAGVASQFQLVRVITGVTNNMTQAANVKLIRFTYA